jgi:glyoxylase-like metal-dependent hydrolase (beta-lactamase superfamily II)
MNIGDIRIVGLHDGTWRFPPTALFDKGPDVWERHHAFLDDDGLLPVELGGYLVFNGDRVLLVDAGVGASSDPGFGLLLENMAAAGVSPADITDVVLTHLHFDHVGWVSDGADVTFPNATYRCDSRDWDFFMGAQPFDESVALEMLGGLTAPVRLGPVAERVETWSSDGPVVPGVDVRAAPGHTPGSTIIVLSSGPERGMLLGDVVHCPAELLEDEWTCIADVDPALATRTREALAREIEGAEIPVSASHFPGLTFGRLLPGVGMRYWQLS